MSATYCGQCGGLSVAGHTCPTPSRPDLTHEATQILASRATPSPEGETCPCCGSTKTGPTSGNAVGNTHDCHVCLTDFTPTASADASPPARERGETPEAHLAQEAANKARWKAERDARTPTPPARARGEEKDRAWHCEPCAMVHVGDCPNGHVSEVRKLRLDIARLTRELAEAREQEQRLDAILRESACPHSDNEGFEAEDAGLPSPRYRALNEDGDEIVLADTPTEAVRQVIRCWHTTGEYAELLRDERDKALGALDATRAEAARLRAALDGEPPESFVAWMEANVPPNTVIASGKWWAPRIWRQVRRALGGTDA